MTTYSFANVSATLMGPGGTISLGNGAGNAEEGITIEPIDDKNTMTTGAGGEVMHSLHAGQAHRFTFRFLKTSPTNNLISTLINYQKTSSAFWGKNTLLVSDPTRGDIVAGTDIAFKKHSTIVYGKEGGLNEWTFEGRAETLLGSGVN
jgi:hypothetical protein